MLTLLIEHIDSNLIFDIDERRINSVLFEYLRSNNTSRAMIYPSTSGIIKEIDLTIVERSQEDITFILMEICRDFVGKPQLLTFPYPIKGIIIPFLNSSFQDDSSMEKLQVSKSDIEEIKQWKKWFFARSIMIEALKYHCPVLGVCLTNDKFPIAPDFSKKNWWGTDEFIATKTQELEGLVKFISLQIGNMDNIIYEIKDYFSLVKSKQTKYVLRMGEHSVEIEPWNIGLTYSAIESFIEAVIHSLIEECEEFDIWIDAVKTSPQQNNHQGEFRGQQAQFDLYYDTLLLQEAKAESKHKAIMDMPTSQETINISTFRYDIGAAYYPYIEYDGRAYDSTLSLPNGIPIDEFQAKLKSNWRQSIMVTPEMTVNQVMEAFRDLVAKAKNARISS